GGDGRGLAGSRIAPGIADRRLPDAGPAQLHADRGSVPPAVLMRLKMKPIEPVPPGLHTFSCIDGHTCGNPVRLVIGGGPILDGAPMSEKRHAFVARFGWVRRAPVFSRL